MVFRCLALPVARITNPSTGTLTNLGSASVTEKFSSTVTQFDDVLIYTHGRHIIKTGYQMNRYNLNVFYSGNAGELGSILYGNGVGGNYSGNGTGGDPSADWALGLPEVAGRGTSSGEWHQRDCGSSAGLFKTLAGVEQPHLKHRSPLRSSHPWIEMNNRQVE